MSCETTDCGSDGSSTSGITNLEIKVIVSGQIAVAPQEFSYKSSDTPEITDVFPSTSIGQTILNYYGQHRVIDYGDGERDLGDFNSVLIFDQQCGLFDIAQDYINYNSNTRLQCEQSSEQEAGRGHVKTHVTAGYSQSHYKMKKTSSSLDE